MTLKFIIKPKWNDDGVDIYINDNMAGKVPKGVEKARVRASYDGAPSGMDLFGFVVEPNFETKTLKSVYMTEK